MSHVISIFPVFKKNIEKELTRRKILYLKHSCYSYSFSSEKFWGQVSLKSLLRSYSTEHRIKCSNNEAIPRFLQSQMQCFPNFCSFFCPSLYCQNKFSGGPILMTFPSLIKPFQSYCPINVAAHEKCPNTELFLVCIFLYSDGIQENKDQK